MRIDVHIICATVKSMNFNFKFYSNPQRRHGSINLSTLYHSSFFFFFVNVYVDKNKYVKRLKSHTKCMTQNWWIWILIIDLVFYSEFWLRRFFFDIRKCYVWMSTQIMEIDVFLSLKCRYFNDEAEYRSFLRSNNPGENTRKKKSVF